MHHPRITRDPARMGGKPCIRDLRFPVSRLLGLLAAGERTEAILVEYPYLEREDIEAALRYAADQAEDKTQTRDAHPSVALTSGIGMK